MMASDGSHRDHRYISQLRWRQRRAQASPSKQPWWRLRPLGAPLSSAQVGVVKVPPPYLYTDAGGQGANNLINLRRVLRSSGRRRVEHGSTTF